VREVEGNRDSRNTVRREPFLGKPNVRFESNASFIEFAVETLDVRLEKRSLNLERKVADPQVKQVFVRQTIPGKTVAHAAETSLGAGVVVSGNLVICKAFSRLATTGTRGTAATRPLASGSGNGAIVAAMERMR
jgi:hypothetical protein